MKKVVMLALVAASMVFSGAFAAQCEGRTQKGERCKHKKDGESDYCKQHAADKKVKETPKQCRAMTWDGKRCVRAPDEGYLYCKQHRK